MGAVSHIRQHFVKAQVNWIESELFRVLPQYQQIVVDFLTRNKPIALANLLYKLRLRAFTGSRARSSDYMDDPFPAKITEMVLKKLGAFAASSTKEVKKPKQNSTVNVDGRSLYCINGPRGKKQWLERHEVLGDGNCGFNAFGITRDEACEFLYDSIDSGAHQAKILDVLRPLLSEAIINGEFIEYVCESLESSQELRECYDYYLQSGNNDKLEAWIDFNRQNVMRIYIEYDIEEKKIDQGWCHPLVLHALAHIRKLVFVGA